MEMDADARIDEVARRAHEAARRGKTERRAGDPRRFHERLEKIGELLKEVHRIFGKSPDQEVALSYASEWLLDNFYIVRQALREIREDMPKGYYHQLPKLAQGETTAADEPRVYDVAMEIIRVSMIRLKTDELTRFVHAYQEIAPLTIGETWALPTMLRAGILEYLAGAVANVAKLSLPDDPAPLIAATLPEDASDEDVVANSILSLRFMAGQDWKTFFEEVNPVERILREDPDNSYPSMDFQTRDLYRKSVEKISLVAKRGEAEVAGTAVRLAMEERDRDERGDRRESHVGYYLMDAGREKLEARLEHRPSALARLQGWFARRPAAIYPGSIGIVAPLLFLVLTSLAWSGGASALQILLVSLLILVPTVTIAVGLVNWVLTHILKPKVLPKMDFGDGIPDDCRTVVVVPALLTDSEEVQSLLHRLELHFLGNPDPNLSFALLTDFSDASEEHRPEDQALLDQAIAGINALNEKRKAAAEAEGVGSRSPFYLFHRKRQWNPGEDAWIGWERKRGKLEEFNRLLLGNGDTSFVVRLGDAQALRRNKYVITLDADTVLPRESAHRLVGTIAHPLNRPRFDPETGKVVAGYTVLQPRTGIMPTSANLSVFTRAFAGDSSLDLYTLAVSDVYQDLFGEGIYVGKGIYDAAAFARSLEGRIPENSLLSHDLFEGLHVRVALATDIVLLEDYPSTYVAYARRLHRWIRGDWQLLPWLGKKPPQGAKGSLQGGFSSIDRWKIVDNLLRSLLAPSLLLLLLCAWLGLTGAPWAWTLFALLTPAVPLAVGTATELVNRMRDRSFRGLRSSFVRTQALRWLLLIVFLPYEAILSLDAIVRTVARLKFTKKRLLEWSTAAHSVRFFKERKLLATFREMWYAPLFALAVAVLLGAVRFPAFLAASPLLVAWFLSPLVAYLSSRPVGGEREELTMGRRYMVRRLARRTWLYFERFVGPDDHWLPPDHFQESPRGAVAHRTSPTNVGLMLLSTMGAFELGYVGLLTLVLRLRNAFDTLNLLERYQGHFLNWYDTRTLEPLPARYVSTVDSGNLACCLLAVRECTLRIEDVPVLRWQRWQGVLDTFDVLDEIVENMEKAASETIKPLQDHWGSIREQVLEQRERPENWASLLMKLEEDERPELDRRLMALMETHRAQLDPSTWSNLRMWTERIRRHLTAIRREITDLAPWTILTSRPPVLFRHADTNPQIRKHWRDLIEALPPTPRLRDVAGICEAAQTPLSILREQIGTNPLKDELVSSAVEWCGQMEKALNEACDNARRMLDDYVALGAQADRYVSEMNFKFLFDSQRQLFHIGYNVDSGQRDGNYYDLLASEARIASIAAIAKGDVPQRHWLHMARPLTMVNGSRGLVSWSGSMFEYLMPTLFLREEKDSLLGQSNRAAVEKQIEYGRKKGTPWGISESAYYRFDANMNYQYRAFGTPGLGFKRGLEDDLVIAPYASLLAMSLRPQAVMENAEALMAIGMLGDFGFYESIDYTSSRLPLGQKHAMIRSYYSHHQGMIFLALTNYLLDDIVVRRIHANPMVQSVELLLHEQVPQRAPVEELRAEVVTAGPEAKPKISATPWPVPVRGPFPQVHFLSNGRYGVMITSAGAGYSLWKDVALTRWRADTTLENSGTWIYLQDLESGRLWSSGYQPVADPEQQCEVLFSPYKVDFRSLMGEISVIAEISVPPDDDMEIRRITLTNRDSRKRRLRIASYGEVVLAPQKIDRRHPAFNKLFIQSEYLPGYNGLLFRRRPRSDDEEPIYLMHALLVEPGIEPTGAHESDRARFLGRGRTVRDPEVFSSEKGLSGTVGTTLDPIMSLGQDLDLEPNTSVQIAYVTMAAESFEKVSALASRYADWYSIDRVFGRTRSQSELELLQLELSTKELEVVQNLLSVLVYPCVTVGANPATIAANTKGQSGLWPFAISGDYPLLLVRIGSEEEIPLVQELLRAHTYWRNRGLEIDLAILNMRESGYAQEVQGQLHRLLTVTGGDGWLNQRGGIFIVRADQTNEEERILLETSARAVLDGDKGPLVDQLREIRKPPEYLPPFSPSKEPAPDVRDIPPPARPDNLLYDNGWGGFTPDGREYVVYLEPGKWPPAPWINVIANSRFGFLVSEAGMGVTWAFNSGENRLTPWSNDPVSDTPGEAVYLRDEETAEVWSPTPLPAGAKAPCLIRHGAGYSVFEHNSRGLKQRVRVFAASDAPAKVIQVRLENARSEVRRITLTYYAEWILGHNRESMQQFVVPEYDAKFRALLARNPYNVEFGEHVAFLAANKEPHNLTTDRAEFLGRAGSFKKPAGLGRIGLSGTVRAGVDPCAAIQLHIDLAPGEAQEVHFLLGQGENREEALRTIKRFQSDEQVRAAWEKAVGFWDGFLGTVQVDTPDQAMNLVLNRWLPYQNLSCRVWGRTAFYQSSGAFGFRDQLQDVMALSHAAPQVAREHILRAARHQFEEGDVLHWFHPPSGRGVRTRMSDDLLWLPFVTAHYVTSTGDESVLVEKIPFLKGDPLESEEEERYGLYDSTSETYTLYDHCLRAIKKGSTKGPHELPLIGTGDWNDGMNRVGIHGKGESIWLGWFLYAALTAFAPLCLKMDGGEASSRLREQADHLRLALEENGWDGQWYLRGYYDSGATLGSSKDLECQIDSLSQSWALLSGAGDGFRGRQAMEAVEKRLVRHDAGLIQLFAPPFDKSPQDPGYIKGYPPGVRENGGQYTHAALWAVWAFAELGNGDLAERLFRLLNPVYHADTAEKAARYRVEPYVVAADVYGAPPFTGRGGWTWYTGSGGWMYRVGLEAILGVRREGSLLRISPCIPKSWRGYKIDYRYGKTAYNIKVENPDGVNVGVKRTVLDGKEVEPGEIPLVDDGKPREATIIMG